MRKIVGWVLIGFGAIYIPFVLVIAWAFLGWTVADNETNGFGSGAILLVIWLAFEIANFSSGRLLNKLKNNGNVLVGWILFLFGIGGLAASAYGIYFTSIKVHDAYILFEIMPWVIFINCVLLTIAGWLLSHPSKKESSV